MIYRSALSSYNTADMMVEIAENSADSTKVLTEMMVLKSGQIDDLLFSLDDMNMRGMQVWAACYYHCNNDINMFINAIESRCPSMVATVNKYCERDCGRAVTSGASHSR